MIDSLDFFEPFTPETPNLLREEAGKLYERCLTEGNIGSLRVFIEQQLTETPPPLELLYAISDDLHQRLVGLRLYCFDVRDKLVQTFWKNYRADITPLAPVEQLNRFHLLSAVALVGCVPHALTLEENMLLSKIVQTALDMSAQLQRDIDLTVQLQDMLADWLAAFQINTARQSQQWYIPMPIEKTSEFLQ
jgi:hypothetical protein